MTRTMKDKDNQMETSNRVFNCFSFLLELWYNSNEKRKTKGKEWKTTSCRGRAFSRSLWIPPNRPRCCCPSDSCLGDRKVCIRCQKLKREEYIKEFIVCKAKLIWTKVCLTLKSWFEAFLQKIKVSMIFNNKNGLYLSQVLDGQ